jgi:hypothetical protein
VTGGADSTVRLWSIEAAVRRHSGGTRKQLHSRELPPLRPCALRADCTAGLEQVLQELPPPHECDAPDESSAGDFVRRLILLGGPSGQQQLIVATDRGYNGTFSPLLPTQHVLIRRFNVAHCIGAVATSAGSSTSIHWTMTDGASFTERGLELPGRAWSRHPPISFFCWAMIRAASL